MARGPIIPKENRGTMSNRPTDVPLAERNMGNVMYNPTGLNHATADAFGDTSGQFAMANAVSNVSDDLFNISVREKRMEQAEEDAELTRRQKEFGVREDQIRLDLQQETMEVRMTPNEKLAEYESRIAATRAELFDGYDWKTYKPETINAQLDEDQTRYHTAYRSGTIEKDRVDRIKGNLFESVNMHLNAGMKAGAKNDIATLQSNLNEITALTNSSQYLAIYGEVGAAEARMKAQSEMAMGFIDSLAATNPHDARALIDDPENSLMQYIPEDARAQAVQQLTRQIDAAQSKIEADRKKATTVEYDRLDLLAAQGELGEIDIMKNTMIDDGQRATLLRRIATGDAARATAKENIALTESMLNAGASFPKPSAAERKQVGAYFESFIGQLSGVEDPARREALVIQEIGRIGHVPTNYKRLIEGNLWNDDNPESQISAARNVSQLIEENPSLSADFDDRTLSVVEMMNRGRTPAKAIEIMTRSSQMTDTEQTFWKQTAKDFWKETPVEESIREYMNEAHDWQWGEEEASIPMGAKSDYQEMFKNNLILTNGDADAALTLTQRGFGNQWGRTNIDGSDRLMKYAPESVYGTGKDNEWMKTQLTEDLERVGVPYEDTVLHISPLSINKEKKAYLLWDKGTGTYVTTPSGTPLEWYPDRSRITNTDPDVTETPYSDVVEGEGDTTDDRSHKEKFEDENAPKPRVGRRYQ